MYIVQIESNNYIEYTEMLNTYNVALSIAYSHFRHLFAKNENTVLTVLTKYNANTTSMTCHDTIITIKKVTK